MQLFSSVSKGNAYSLVLPFGVLAVIWGSWFKETEVPGARKTNWFLSAATLEEEEETEICLW